MNSKLLCAMTCIIMNVCIIHAQTYIAHVNLVDVINLKIESDETVEIVNGKIST